MSSSTSILSSIVADYNSMSIASRINNGRGLLQRAQRWGTKSDLDDKLDAKSFSIRIYGADVGDKQQIVRERASSASRGRPAEQGKVKDKKEGCTDNLYNLQFRITRI